jgi:hypothetical protein
MSGSKGGQPTRTDDQVGRELSADRCNPLLDGVDGRNTARVSPSRGRRTGDGLLWHSNRSLPLTRTVGVL